MEKKHLSLIAFVLIVSSLFFIDYQIEHPGNKRFFLSSILQNLLQPSQITTELLSKTSLKDSSLQDEDALSTFFDPYLPLPEKTALRRYSLSDSSIRITEIGGTNALKLVQNLLQQQNPDYQFNKINAGTFYLNQLPIEKKTHNFLGIIVHETLYGFQYLPKDHPQVLEIIDALQQNK